MSDVLAASASSSSAATSERRGILAGLLAAITGLVVGLVPLAAGGLFALDPIRRKRERFRGSQEGFFPVTMLADLPVDGTPMRFTIRADMVDAWNLFKDRTIGSVYLRRIPEASSGQVIAFTDVCPHLGCKITYQASAKHFFCPCHASTFDLDGDKINKIPPRNMDSLEVKVADDGRVWVKYQDFRGAIAEKQPV